MPSTGSISAGLGRLVHDSVLWHRPASFGRSLIYLLIVLAGSVGVARWAYFMDGTAMLETHTSISLELAMARAYCGQPSLRSTTIRLPPAIVASPELRARPLRSIIIERAGSLAAYCRALDWPYVQAENSLMLTEAALLKLMPGLSLTGLGQALHAIRTTMLLAFVLMLLDLGASLALGGATLLCGLMILQAMPDRVYSHYPFLFPMVLAATAWHVFALKYRWTARWPGLLLYGAVAGAASAFIANMRTSYLAIAVALFAWVAVEEIRKRGDAPVGRRTARLAGLAACFAAGFVAFQSGLIMRHLPAEGRYEAAHTTAHPLVLALAVPENDFSRAMGIRWDDAVGIEKAATIDSEAAYLSARYNAALMQYYRSLWREHTRAMIGTYYLKFSIAGADMIEVLRRSPGTVGWMVMALLTPLSWLPNGVWLLALYGAIVGSAVMAHNRRESPALAALALITMAACVIQIESGVIFSVFSQQYHNLAAFYALFLSLLGAQALVNGAWLLRARMVE